MSSGSPYWLDDVRIPMQIYDTGALYMEFNGQVLPFDGSTPPLAGFENLFLDYLGLVATRIVLHLQFGMVTPIQRMVLSAEMPLFPAPGL